MKKSGKFVFSKTRKNINIRRQTCPNSFLRQIRRKKSGKKTNLTIHVKEKEIHMQKDLQRPVLQEFFV